MSNKLYVGNLPWSVREDKLKELFSESLRIEEKTALLSSLSWGNWIRVQVIIG